MDPTTFSRRQILFIGGCALCVLLLVLVTDHGNDRKVWEINSSPNALRDKTRVRVVCLGDTHSHHDQIEVPDADILVFTGDMTDPHSDVSNRDQIVQFADWLQALPHTHKVVVAGNHDPEGSVSLATLPDLFPGVTYLQDTNETFAVRGVAVNVFGSPWQPQYENFETFMEEGPALNAVWEKIPTGVHIVATHSPPRDHHDIDPKGSAVGSTSLQATLENRVKPLLSCFGHIHYSYGRSFSKGIHWANGAICNDDLVPVHEPHTFDILL